MKTKKQPLALALSRPFLPDCNECLLHGYCENACDEEIAQQVKADKECFAMLVGRYDRKIKSYIRKITGVTEETAEDIAQEVFLKVFLNIHKFDTSMKFSSWLYRIAHNEAVNRYLYEKRRVTEGLVWEDSGEIKNEAHYLPDVEREIEQQVYEQKIALALGNISEKYGKVIELNCLKGKSYKEVSAELEMPVNTIGTLLIRGKKMLKHELMNLGISREAVMV
jgi:RNA polymerase sigma-70 factor (ECF subfamily)